jgi:hypothetical protein
VIKGNFNDLIITSVAGISVSAPKDKKKKEEKKK